MNSAPPHGTLRRVARVLQVSQLVALGLLFGAGSLLWRNIEEFRLADTWVDHSHNVRSQIDLVRLSVLRGGLALRNFAIAPRPEFLQSIVTLSGEAKAQSARLESMVADNPDQALRAREMHSETTEILGWYRSSQVIAQRDGFEAFHSALKTRVDIDASSRLRQLLNDMDAEERKLLEARRQFRDEGFESIKQWAAAVVALFTLFSLGSLFHAGQLVSRGEQKLKALQTDADKDPLTGLYNRRAVDRYAKKMAGKPLSVITFDLNNFKPVNDRFGHAAGDVVLRTVAERLHSQSRGDDVIARLGGDEFLVLLPGMHDERTIASVASRIGAAIAEPMHFEGIPLSIGASIGYASTQGEADLSRLVKAADAMSYEVKRRSKTV